MTKKIVICCDGTWNTADQQATTNVVRIHKAVRPADAQGTKQLAYYHPGVGTSGWWDHLVGGAFGLGLSRNVRDAYRYVVENFTPGDELYFFGFSRGAYTVRSVTGFIRNCGILRPEFANKIDEAYDLYRNRKDHTRPARELARSFREKYSYESNIRFIGVWDTVGSLGIPLTGFPLINLFNRRFQFHDTELSRSVDGAFQALSIDERRRPFRPAVWRKHPRADGQQVEQVWFSGVHSDIGGAYAERELGDITFAWMAEHARDCGLALDVETLAPEAFGPMHDSMTFLYRLMGPYSRRLDPTDPSQAVASTAYKRHERLPKKYSPRNLVRYLRANGSVKDI